MITIKFDDTSVTEQEIITLSQAIQGIVSTATEIEDVFVYADSPRIKIKVAPIEIFIEMTAQKITDRDMLMRQIKDSLLEWKKESNFTHPINLSLIPMDWNIEIGI